MMFVSLFETGNIAFFAIAVMLAEALVFVRFLTRVPGMFAGLAAGGCLVLALRAALLDLDWTNIALFLSLSFFFHVLELVQWLRHAKEQPQ